ncbi:MAG: hypothetical protein LV480_03685 [Methylacidiphilales bacterium]|nr:hypothetical protein [Candidatus Methylacidiphilales bacterium]
MTVSDEREPEYREVTSSTPIAAHLDGQACAFKDAASFIESRCSHATDPQSLDVCQKSALEGWARDCGTLVRASVFHGLEVVSECTSEHKVFYRADDNRAIKRTWAGVYGQIPTVQDCALSRRNALPSEYLRRMALQISVFKSDIQLVGVFISEEPSMIIGQPPGEPSLVISQEWFEKDAAPSLTEIADYMRSEGFVHDPKAYFGWYRTADGVIIVDAKPDNFIKTIFGLMPIDLQMAQFSIRQMKEIGLEPPKPFRL